MKFSINNKSTEASHRAYAAIAAAGCTSSSSNKPTIACNDKDTKEKQKQFYRKGGGKVWYDPTMKQWSNSYVIILPRYIYFILILKLITCMVLIIFIIIYTFYRVGTVLIYLYLLRYTYLYPSVESKSKY